MEFEYFFVASLTKPQAFESYLLSSNITWLNNIFIRLNLSTNFVAIYTNRELTPMENQELTTLIDNYIEPETFLIFSKGETFPMSTKCHNEETIESSGQKILQTFIFNKQDDPTTVLNSCKTVVEYHCPDINAFDSNVISGSSIDLEIYDITRDISISSLNVPLAEIETKWKSGTNPNNTDTVFRTAFFSSIQYSLPNFDCVWQIRSNLSHPSFFDIRLHSLQYLFYVPE